MSLLNNLLELIKKDLAEYQVFELQEELEMALLLLTNNDDITFGFPTIQNFNSMLSKSIRLSVENKKTPEATEVKNVKPLKN